MEEFDGYEDLVSGVGGFEEDDGFEVFAEGDALAVEVDDLGDGAVGVGAELEGDAGAGDVVAVEGLGDFDLAAIPDGFVRSFGFGSDDGPGGVVEGGGFAMGDVADVEAPVAWWEGVEGLEGVELGYGGGGEIFLLANWSEGLCEEGGAGEQEGEGEPAKTHRARVANEGAFANAGVSYRTGSLRGRRSLRDVYTLFRCDWWYRSSRWSEGWLSADGKLIVFRA